MNPTGIILYFLGVFNNILTSYKKSWPSDRNVNNISFIQ